MSKDEGRTPLTASGEKIVGEVRKRYGMIASGQLSGCCGSEPGWCGTTEEAVATGIGYTPQDLAAIPQGANLGLGCGAPLQFLDLREGETVVDLGAGAGVDAFLAARKVGPGGKVIGVDMTPAMLEKARKFAAESGFTWVEFREGRLENLPVDTASVDAVTSNCVINLVPDKAAVFHEIARVLRPGGRLVISDMVLDGELPEVVAQNVLAYVGCVAGAMRREAYFALLADAGLTDLTIHRDIDYVRTAGYSIGPDLHAKLEAAGLRAEQLEGIVRSITYGARRR